MDRRNFIASSLAMGATALGASPALAATTSKRLFELARAELIRLGSDIRLTDLVGVSDFTNPSRVPRFHILDMGSGKITSLLVAHGRGSDPAHQGWVQRFSNEVGSAASSSGAYRTGDYYVGKHGRSMRLHGLDATNSNALNRAVVVHGAWYVGPDMVRSHGKLGRSEGCFAFAENDLDQVLNRLGPGRLLIAGKF